MESNVLDENLIGNLIDNAQLKSQFIEFHNKNIIKSFTYTLEKTLTTEKGYKVSIKSETSYRAKNGIVNKTIGSYSYFNIRNTGSGYIIFQSDFFKELDKTFRIGVFFMFYIVFIMIPCLAHARAKNKSEKWSTIILVVPVIGIILYLWFHVKLSRLSALKNSSKVENKARKFNFKQDN